MSTSRTGRPSQSQSRLIESRVIPASGPVIIRSSPSIRLTRVDLPALGRPTIGELERARLRSVLVLGFARRSRSTCGRSASNRSATPSPCSALIAIGSPRPRRKASKMPGFAGAALGLVGDDDHRRRFDPQPAADLLVERSQALARIDQEQSGVGLAHRGLGLLPHPAGQRVRVLVLEAGGVDHPELEPEQLRLALAPVAGHARPVVDQRQALADQPVEQGRFADVGPADDGDGGEGHGARDSSAASRRRRGLSGTRAGGRCRRDVERRIGDHRRQADRRRRRWSGSGSCRSPDRR